MSSGHDIYQYKVGHGFDVLNIHLQYYIQLWLSEEVNIQNCQPYPSGVDNFGYSPIQRAVTVLLYRTNC
jgi:hypothetical protein